MYSAQTAAQAEIERRKRTGQYGKQLPLLTWMRKARPLLAADRPFNLDEHKYLRDIYADECKEQIIQKAAQMGASEYLVSYGLWSSDERGANCIYIFPTDRHITDFSSARFGPATEPLVSPYLASIVIGARGSELSRGARGADRVTLKRIRDRYFYFRGAKISPDGKAPQLKSIDGDIIILDEVDEMDIRAPEIARKRLGHSMIGEVRQVSTPTYANFGINAEYLRSDQRQWYLRCKSCNRLQPVTIDNLIIESDDLGRPVSWNNKDGVPFLRCAFCPGEIDRLGNGEWIAAYPGREIHGYQLSGLFASRRKLEEIVSGLAKIEESDRQQVYNQDLGIPYRPSSSMALTDNILDGARRDIALVKPHSKELKSFSKICAGIDVGSLLHIVIRGRDERGDYVPLYIGTVREFDAAEKIIKEYSVRTCVIDALPETRKAIELQGRVRRGVVWLAYYAQQDRRNDYAAFNPQEQVASIDRTRSLDETMSAIRMAAAGDPGSTLPAAAREIRDYYKQLKAPERRIEKNSKGEEVAVYIESGPDHYAHAENYCKAAFLCPFGGGWARGASS